MNRRTLRWVHGTIALVIGLAVAWNAHAAAEAESNWLLYAKYGLAILLFSVAIDAYLQALGVQLRKSGQLKRPKGE